ncbi:hypothetical protein JOF53_008334 [Crossiella equi]|uniref:Uncharacterized protein n=1 Tax=Crossiella equi TaxID=130796 RepID=A0ABS5AT85_9PSEU|nr:hypothetical protein [Crossiella equi]MBP2479462.1 hypothetical protein [Crossiella equi]
MAAVPADGSLRLRVLGPPRLWRDGAAVDPGPRQQARLLALFQAVRTRLGAGAGGRAGGADAQDGGGPDELATRRLPR